MKHASIAALFAALALPLAAHAGWLPTGWGDFYYTNTVNWTDGVIDNAYDAAFSGKATQNLLFDAPFTFTNGLSFTHPGEITTVFRGQGGNTTVAARVRSPSAATRTDSTSTSTSAAPRGRSTTPTSTSICATRSSTATSAS